MSPNQRIDATQASQGIGIVVIPDERYSHFTPRRSYYDEQGQDIRMQPQAMRYVFGSWVVNLGQRIAGITL